MERVDQTPEAHPDLDGAALVLAAGPGTRMMPFTETTPKPLLTVNNEELLGRSLSQVFTVTPHVAVNTHHLRHAVESYLEGRRVHLSVETREPLGTAGAVAAIQEWLDGRDLLIANADTWVETIPRGFIESWDHERPRLLVVEVGHRSDFGTDRFVGVSLLPGALAKTIPVEPGGLYERVWRSMLDRLDLYQLDGRAFDCGTPEEFLAANLTVSGGRSVIHPTARPGGPVEDSVFLRGAKTPPGYAARAEIRDGFGHSFVSRLHGGPTVHSDKLN